MTSESRDEQFDDLYHYPTNVERFMSALSALNFNAVKLFFRNGKSSALDYLGQSHRLYSGFGRLGHSTRPSWCRDTVPSKSASEIFPEIDFTKSADMLFPMQRDLGISTQELNIISKVVGHFRPQKVVEFGTAEGRTAVNIAMQLPPDGEIITLDFPPIPGKNDIGYFYWEHPVKSKIKQVFCGVGAWDSKPHRESADIVFCDACDLMPGVAAEVYQAFSIVKPGGVIFRHDYGAVKGTTIFWNWLARELPVWSIQDTTLLCLRVDPETYSKMIVLLRHPVISNSIEIPQS